MEDARVRGSVADLHLHGEADHAHRREQQRLGEGRRRRRRRRRPLRRRRRRLRLARRRRRLRPLGAGHGRKGGKRERGWWEARRGDETKAEGEKATEAAVQTGRLSSELSRFQGRPIRSRANLKAH